MSVIGQITCVEFNWYVVAENGCQEDTCESHIVGYMGVKGIEQVDTRVYVVSFINGEQEIIYNPNKAYWAPNH